MGSVKSEAYSQVDVSSVLSDEIIYFVPEHYDALAYSILRTKAEELGAQIAEYADATIIIVNENSPLWDEDAKEALLDDLRTSDPVILPYHWLSACLDRQRRVTVDDLDVPFMVQPLPERFPLKVWVSKNVQRDVNEEADDAYKKVVRQLESVGALSVVKRAHADVLVVDMASNFFQTVKKEKEDNRRDWQKLAQRDWVDFCIANGTLQLTTPKDEEGTPAGSETGGAGEVEVDQNGEEVDSMMDEDSPVRAGPGRPTGKPRVEYTPEDDDFLCRYLAYNYPDGSWGSRKTYQALVSDQLEYPMAARHTSQSWHERFRKNSAAFSRRLTRFINENVDRSLKTAPERAAAAAKQAQRDAEAERAATPTGSPDRPAPAASTSRQADAAPLSVLVPETIPSAQRSGRSHAPPNRNLVAADSLSPPPQRPATELDPKGKRREVEPVAGPSRTSEVAFQHTQAELESASTSILRSTNANQVTLGTSADDLVPAVGAAVKSDSARPTGLGNVSKPENPETTTQALPKKKRKRASVIDIPAEPASTVSRSRNSASRRHETPINDVETRIPPGSTPLRQEIERSNEKRRREQQRKAHAHGSSSRRLSKRASSPDKVYAHVNLPPPRPVTAPVQESTPEPPRRRTPPRELTPAEREQSVLAGSRIVQDIAAQYRLRVAALGKKFGVGIKEISAATNEVKRRNGGKSAVDWNMLEMVLQEQYGR